MRGKLSDEKLSAFLSFVSEKLGHLPSFPKPEKVREITLTRMILVQPELRKIIS